MVVFGDLNLSFGCQILYPMTERGLHPNNIVLMPTTILEIKQDYTQSMGTMSLGNKLHQRSSIYTLFLRTSCHLQIAQVSG